MRWLAPPLGLRRTFFLDRAFICAASSLLCLAALLSGSRVAAAASSMASEPRLILPGDRVVRAGQWIDLRWEETDSISELEILLSLDGGRRYTLCISPRLDPRRHDYVWRVPPLPGGALRMRIRFNRGGREIEGAPAAPLFVFGGSDRQPEPLALPPLGGGTGERAPRPSGGGETPAGRLASGRFEIDDESPPARRSASKSSVSMIDAPATSRPPEAATHSAFAAPRSVPLRT